MNDNKENLFLELPIIPLRGIVVFPKMVLHFDVGRRKSVKALQKAMDDDQRVFLVCQKDTTDEYIKSLRVKTPNQETKISSLSGGNQQKVILARWLLTDPTVLLLDEPTRGIDVGAKYEIYQLILDLAKKGKTVIMVSSEMAELLGVCDKILVMSGGRLSGEVDAKTTNQEEIMTLAAKYV